MTLEGTPFVTKAGAYRDELSACGDNSLLKLG
jgi:hypothetical protein